MTIEELEILQTTDIENVDKKTLIDIKKAITQNFRPTKDQITEFFETIGNPYCFLVERTPVKISFSRTGKTLDEAVAEHLTNQKKRMILVPPERKAI